MAEIQLNGVTIHYQESGSGEETIVFAHGFLMNHTMFAAQVAALSEKYRVIAYDHRSHGRSEVVKAPYGIYDIMEDGAALIESLVDGPVHFMGMSTGGFVGLRLLVRRPELLKSLVLMDTSADAESADALKQYNLMLNTVRLLGPRPVVGRALAILMGEPFRHDAARRAEFEQWKQSILQMNKTGIYHFGRAIFDRDSVVEKIKTADLPTLVIVGEEDIATPPAKAEQIAAAIPNAKLVTIPNAGHTSPVEEPEAVTQAIAEFLAGMG